MSKRPKRVEKAHFGRCNRFFEVRKRAIFTLFLPLAGVFLGPFPLKSISNKQEKFVHKLQEPRCESFRIIQHCRGGYLALMRSVEALQSESKKELMKANLNLLLDILL